MKIVARVGLALLLLVVVIIVYLYSQLRSLTVEQITDDLYVLYGVGGNVGVLKTDVGTVVVDTMTFEIQGERILDKAQELTGAPVVMVINTHYHSDHTHGNPAFPTGTRVVATERTLHHLQVTDTDFFSGDAQALLPNETFTHFKKIQIGNKTLELHQTGRGHTDGDLAVLFVEDNVIHTGDLFFNHHYPNIDLEGGGSVQAWADTLTPLLQLEFDQVIPGHGPLSDRAGLIQFQQFMQQLAGIGLQAAEKNWTLEQMQTTDALTADEGYSEIFLVIPSGLDRQFVLTRTWEEVTGNFVLRP